MVPAAARASPLLCAARLPRQVLRLRAHRPRLLRRHDLRGGLPPLGEARQHLDRLVDARRAQRRPVRPAEPRHHAKRAHLLRRRSLVRAAGHHAAGDSDGERQPRPHRADGPAGHQVRGRLSAGGPAAAPALAALPRLAVHRLAGQPACRPHDEEAQGARHQLRLPAHRVCALRRRDLPAADAGQAAAAAGHVWPGPQGDRTQAKVHRRRDHPAAAGRASGSAADGAEPGARDDGLLHPRGTLRGAAEAVARPAPHAHRAAGQRGDEALRVARRVRRLAFDACGGGAGVEGANLPLKVVLSLRPGDAAPRAPQVGRQGARAAQVVEQEERARARHQDGR
mmetsp:Transcript_7271/g.22855  ORF Transcript_7271/g.22855 Transcript_7271/m.22855 type:complete len:339 (+) Transcript_7271:1237-2253(+)